MWGNVSAAGAIGHAGTRAGGVIGMRRCITCLDNGRQGPPGWPMDPPSAFRIIDRQQRDGRRNERSSSAGGRPVDPTVVARANSANVYPPRSGRTVFTGCYGSGVSDVAVLLLVVAVGTAKRLYGLSLVF